MAAFTPAQARFVDSLRVARLATSSRTGEPHLIPICFVRLGDAIYTAVDRKPKRTSHLKRVRNIAATGRAAVLFDRYSDDWDRLGWVMVRGPAEVLSAGAEREEGIGLLRGKYEQYNTMDLTSSLVIRVAANQVATWGNLN